MAAKDLNPASVVRPRLPLAHRDVNAPGQSRFNDEVTSAIRSLAAGPLGSVSIVDVTVETTETKVTHRLGRPFQGWILVDRTDTGTIRRVPAPSGETEDHATHFWLQSSVAEAVRVLVF